MVGQARAIGTGRVGDYTVCGTFCALFHWGHLAETGLNGGRLCCDAAYVCTKPRNWLCNVTVSPDHRGKQSDLRGREWCDSGHEVRTFARLFFRVCGPHIVDPLFRCIFLFSTHSAHTTNVGVQANPPSLESKYTRKNDGNETCRVSQPRNGMNSWLHLFLCSHRLMNAKREQCFNVLVCYDGRCLTTTAKTTERSTKNCVCTCFRQGGQTTS